MFTLLVSGALGATADGHGDLDRGRDGLTGALVGGSPVLLPRPLEPRHRPDTLGLLLARVVLEAFTTDGEALTVAVDEALFHRYGRKVFGVFWQHDGSAKGRDGIGRGNCFVIVGVVVGVPCTDRRVFLPLLFRLHQPKTGASKPEQAKAMVRLDDQAS